MVAQTDHLRIEEADCTRIATGEMEVGVTG